MGWLDNLGEAVASGAFYLGVPGAPNPNAEEKRASMEEARRQLGALQQYMMQQRMGALGSAMQFFQPANAQMQRLFGQGFDLSNFYRPQMGPQMGGGALGHADFRISAREQMASQPGSQRLKSSSYGGASRVGESGVAPSHCGAR